MILYLVDKFPSGTEHFILNEISSLKKAQLAIQVAALQKGNTELDIEYRSIKPFYPDLSLKKILYSIYFISRHFKSVFCLFFKGCYDSHSGLHNFLKHCKRLTFAILLLSAIRKLNVKHIHAHFLSEPAEIARYISIISGIPFSASAHAHDIFTTSRLRLTQTIGSAKFIITCTKYAREYLAAIMTSDESKKILQVYHGIDNRAWPVRKIQRQETKKIIKIISIGRLIEKKGLIYLVEALSLIQNAAYSIKCSIVGDGILRSSLEEAVRAFNLCSTVQFHGELTHRQIKEMYSEADLLVLACVRSSNGDMDGLPNVLLEALSTGVPVISTALSAIPELIKHNQTGLIVEPNNAVSIAKAIDLMASNFELRNKMIINGRKLIEKEFSLDTARDKLLEIFQTRTGK